MDEAIGRNTKFAVIALSNVSTTIQSPVIISDKIAIYPKLSFNLNSQWERWIGALAAEEISKANFILLSTLPTSKPQEFDAENQQLRETVLKFMYSLLVLGVPTYRELHVMNGANREGIVEVRQLSEMPPFYIGLGNLPYQITGESVVEAGKVFTAIENIFSSPGEFLQIRKGFKTFLKAISEGQEYDRLHQFVRSLDALIMSERGSGGNCFLDSCFGSPAQRAPPCKARGFLAGAVNFLVVNKKPFGYTGRLILMNGGDEDVRCLVEQGAAECLPLPSRRGRI